VDLNVVFDSLPRGDIYYPMTTGTLLMMTGEALLLVNGGAIDLNLAATTTTYPIFLTVHAPDLSISF